MTGSNIESGILYLEPLLQWSLVHTLNLVWQVV